MILRAITAGVKRCAASEAEIHATMDDLLACVPQLDQWAQDKLCRLMAQGDLLPKEVDIAVRQLGVQLAKRAKEGSLRPIACQTGYFVAILKRLCLDPRGISWENR